MKRSPNRYTTPKRDKIPQKSRNLLVYIVELFIGGVKVVIKVINASLSQNQCLQRETPPLMHVEIPRPRDATELNNDGMIKLGDIYYELTANNIFIIFFERDLINDNSSFCSRIRSTTDLQCHVFPFEDLLLNVCLCL